MMRSHSGLLFAGTIIFVAFIVPAVMASGSGAGSGGFQNFGYDQGRSIYSSIGSSNSMYGSYYESEPEETPTPEPTVNPATVATPEASGTEPPVITEISPNEGIAGSSVPFTLTGSNLKSEVQVILSREGSTDISTNATISGDNLTGTFTLPNDATPGVWRVSVNEGDVVTISDVFFTITGSGQGEDAGESAGDTNNLSAENTTATEEPKYAALAKYSSLGDIIRAGDWAALEEYKAKEHDENSALLDSDLDEFYSSNQGKWESRFNPQEIIVYCGSCG